MAWTRHALDVRGSIRPSTARGNLCPGIDRFARHYTRSADLNVMYYMLRDRPKMAVSNQLFGSLCKRVCWQRSVLLEVWC